MEVFDWHSRARASSGWADDKAELIKLKTIGFCSQPVSLTQGRLDGTRQAGGAYYYDT